jgi:hypothetical protein
LENIMAELYATKEAILAASRKPVRVTIKALGGDVFLRPMSGAERIQYRETFAEMGENATDLDVRRRIQEPAIASGLVSETGVPQFAAEEVSALGNAAIDEISQELLRISGMLAASAGEAEKNSSATQSGALPSA